MMNTCGSSAKAWLAVLGCCVILLPCLLAGLGAPAPSHGMEKLCLTSSQETWLRQTHGEPEAWLVPTLNDHARIHKPPLTVWLNLLAWHGLDPDTASVEAILFRSRLVSVLLGLLLVAATYWIGWLLVDSRLAAASALITGTLFLFLRQARTAAYDIQLAAWVTAAVAAGLWALRQTGPDGSRGRVIRGWALSGVALGAAVLTKGPVAYGWMVLPLAAGIPVLTTDKRAKSLAGLLFAVLLGTALAAPWYAYVLTHAPGAQQQLFREYQAQHYKTTQSWYYLQILPLALPWSWWLAGGLALPFLRSYGRRSRELLFLWLWFVVAVVALSVPELKAPRYLAPLLPVTGLLSAYFLLYREGSKGQWVESIHWLLPILASLLVPVYLLMEGYLVRRGLVEAAQFSAFHPLLVVPLGILLAVFCFAGWRWRHARLGAAIVTALWMVALGTVGYTLRARSPAAEPRARGDAERILTEAGQSDLFYFWENPGRDSPPGQELTFYLRRVVHPIGLRELTARLREDGPVHILVAGGKWNERCMRKLGLEKGMDFGDDNAPLRYLYHRRAGDDSSPQPGQ